MRRLDEKTNIPVIYDGVVVGIVNDFLGKSVIIEHDLADSDTNRFCTIYGHLNPHKGLHVGRVVNKHRASTATRTRLVPNHTVHLPALQEFLGLLTYLGDD